MRRERRRARAGGAAALVAILLSAGACTPLDDAMVAIFGRSMRSSVSFDPYENPRLPAPNTVPFASGNYPAELGAPDVAEPAVATIDVPPMTPADVGQPGSPLVNALENPIPADSASLARGRVVYERMCSVCHGVDGYSAQSIMVQEIATAAGIMGAWNLADGASTGYSDGYIYAMIRIGRGLMPSYGHRITHLDRWHVVNYVRELQRRAGELIPPGGAAGAAADTAGAGAAAAGDTTPPDTSAAGAGGPGSAAAGPAGGEG